MEFYELHMELHMELQQELYMVIQDLPSASLANSIHFEQPTSEHVCLG